MPSTLTPDEQLAIVRRLATAERDTGRVAVAIGPFAAFLMSSALEFAARHPDLDGTSVRIAGEIAQSARAGMTPTATHVVDEIHASESDDPAAPSAQYVANVAALMALERDREHFGLVEIGPYSSFLVIGLLQFVTRHPAFGPATPSYAPLVEFARHLASSHSPEVRGMVEDGFDPINDVDADGRRINDGDDTDDVSPQ